jgi:hypothetical protein
MATSILRENQVALAGHLAHGRGFKTRFCWECQKDKPVSTGKIFGIKGANATLSAGKLRFACAECIEARAQRKAQRAKEAEAA